MFHSFSEFSVPTGIEAHFNNAVDVQNIFGRVTGKSVSNIDGLIRANGTANLFLINPSGIIFGKNASLNVGGSFVGSTASSLKFADGTEFSATAPSPTPLLTISVPIGLQFGENPGSIQVQGDGQGIRETEDLIDTTFGLRVQPNQTLALMGGDVNLQGAALKTAGGRIELGSVAGSFLVSLTPINKGFSLGYSAVQNFGNIQLSQQTAVDPSGEGGGDVQVWGRRITLTNGSQIQADTLGSKPGGTLVINALDSVQLIGGSSDNFLILLSTATSPSSTGGGGDLTINTRDLLLQDGSWVRSGSFGVGQGGSLTVNATDSVQLIGNRFPSQLFNGTGSSSTGAGGNLTINTRELVLKERAEVNVETFGAGKSGNLIVNADRVQLLNGTNVDSEFANGLFAATELGATGAAGDLTINTRELVLRDGAQVNAGTFSAGKSGNLTVNADSVKLIGRTASPVQFAGTTVYSRAPSGLLVQADLVSTGAAGDLKINTRELLVQDGAGVFVRSRRKGNAGNLTVDARSIRLDNATLNADTQSINTDPNKEQATITLVGVEDLILRHNSNITTNARGSNVIGGNINIDAKNGFIIAVPQENSDISANSSDFRGGQVKINTNGIFGTQFRNASTPLSDITAIGKDFSLNGIVQINTPDIDPSRGLTQLSANLVDASSQIDNSCNPGSKQRASSFVVTGRGGLPPNPRTEPLTNDAVQVDWVSLKPSSHNHKSPTLSKKPTPTRAPIVRATGWMRNAKGEVVLTANASNTTPPRPGLNPASCHASRSN